ncbi:hypothetical protein LMH87_002076 [Akanthomyces muscarius]|uniref:Zn(2)-C6 fungal-type domain-containing protein n=1 Tax=Akanthomyces muscarius TaxID=2231603 RepID=A0A9W8UJ18_AKAMU|nr:hypothetical protein LMH87_002076 [Akanthomyces muscarius]KAJ4147564.1 hypothetical protein LMH87_002076 [Akanthomyces muscarius]
MPKRSATTRPQPSAEHRRRVYAACSECRRRRRKCNGSQPCAQCSAYGYACTYEAESAAAAQNAPPGAASSSRHRPAEPIRRRQGRRVASPADEEEAALPPSTPLIVSRERGRFINANSAVALPHLVGQQLSVSQPLRLHSYAWNLGLRPERRGTVSSSLAEYLTLAECQALCAVYFAAVHPLFAFLCQDSFSRRLVDSWATLESQPNFAAVVALVAVLGSFFSTEAHPREQDVKRHGLAILDLALSAPVAAIDLDAVAGWLLRTLYMRLTTRPAISCMASHVAMHFAEIMGLHRDLVDDGTDDAAAAKSAAFGLEELESRRRHFCVARFLNVLLTTEYGVSGPAPRHTNCLSPARIPGAHIEVLHTITRVLQEAEAAASAGLDSDDYAELFQHLKDIPHDDDTVALFTADACLCLLRRFAASSRGPSPQIVTMATAILRRALDGITALLAAERTWWSMLSVPFQSICVGVSADHAALLALLPTAMGLLRAMADKFASHMAKEALATAQQVITASRGSTEAKLAMQDAALAHALPAVDIDWAGFDFDMGGDWPVVDFLM